MINITRFTGQLINSFYGQGNLVYVGAGGIFSTISRTYSDRLKEDRSDGKSIISPKGKRINPAYTVGLYGATTNQVSGANGAQTSTIFMANRFWKVIIARRRQLAMREALATSEGRLTLSLVGYWLSVTLDTSSNRSICLCLC